MKAMGFSTLLDKKREGSDGYIISSFKFPEHPNFHFEDFYKRLSSLGMDILNYSTHIFLLFYDRSGNLSGKSNPGSLLPNRAHRRFERRRHGKVDHQHSSRSQGNESLDLIKIKNSQIAFLNFFLFPHNSQTLEIN